MLNSGTQANGRQELGCQKGRKDEDGMVICAPHGWAEFKTFVAFFFQPLIVAFRKRCLVSSNLPFCIGIFLQFLSSGVVFMNGISIHRILSFEGTHLINTLDHHYLLFSFEWQSLELLSCILEIIIICLFRFQQFFGNSLVREKLIRYLFTGGILDRADSYIFTGALAYSFVKTFLPLYGV